MNRIVHIDIAKGMSIIFVVFAHSHIRFLLPELDQVLGLFRVPLFFFLAGVVFNLKPMRTVFLQKTDRLLKPYYVSLVFILLVSAIFGGSGLLQEALGILYGNGETIRWEQLWFLTHLWCVFLFVNFVELVIAKYSNKTRILVAVTILFFVLGPVPIGMFMGYPVVFGMQFEIFGLPMSLDLLLLTSGFFLAGRLLAKYLKEFRPHLILFAIALGLLISISQFTDAYVNLNVREYQSPVFATIAAFSGIYCCVCLAYLISKVDWLSNVISFVGFGSLFILVFHPVIERNSVEFMSYFVSHSFTFFPSFILAIFVPLIIRAIISSYALLRVFYFPISSQQMSSLRNAFFNFGK